MRARFRKIPRPHNWDRRSADRIKAASTALQRGAGMDEIRRILGIERKRAEYIEGLRVVVVEGLVN